MPKRDRICVLTSVTSGTVLSKCCVSTLKCRAGRIENSTVPVGVLMYRGTDKSLTRPGKKKLIFLSEWRVLLSAPCLAGKKIKLDDSSRLDVVEIAQVPDVLPSLFPSRSG